MSTQRTRARVPVVPVLGAKRTAESADRDLTPEEAKRTVREKNEESRKAREAARKRKAARDAEIEKMEKASRSAKVKNAALGKIVKSARSAWIPAPLTYADKMDRANNPVKYRRAGVK
jgi:hypothetical protein